MKTLENLLILGVFLLVIISSYSVLAQEDLIDICAGDYAIKCGSDLSLSGNNFEISDKGVITFTGDNGELIINQGKANEIILEGTQGIKIFDFNKISITDKNSKLTINGNVFEDLAPGRSFIVLDQKEGDILTADFWADVAPFSPPKIYKINDVEFSVDQTFNHVKYDKRDGFEFSEKTEIKSVETATTIEGNDLKLLRNNKQHDLTGTLNFDSKGDAYILKDEITEIDKVEIKSSIEDRANIFFDGKEHDGNYVSFGNRKLIFNSPVEANFKKNNPYLKIEEYKRVGYEFSPGSNYNVFDYVKLRVDPNSKITLENRDSIGLIPKLTLEKGTFNLENDGSLLTYRDGEIYFEKSDHKIAGGRSSKISSSPLEIVSKDNPEFGRIIFDNFKRYGVYNLNEGQDNFLEEEIFERDIRTNKIFSNRINYNYPNKEDVEKILGISVAYSFEKERTFTKEEEHALMSRVLNYFGDLTDETKQSIGKIKFKTDESSITLEYKSFDKSLNFDPIASFNYHNFRHEAAHARDRELAGVLYKVSDSEFQKRWRSISGDYDKVSKDNKYRNNEYIDAPGDYSPREGYFSPYGGTNIFEDIAEFVGGVGSSKKLFKSLLSEENEWHEIYRKKLDLLLEDKYISQEEYNAVLEVAGVQ